MRHPHRLAWLVAVAACGDPAPAPGAAAPAVTVGPAPAPAGPDDWLATRRAEADAVTPTPRPDQLALHEGFLVERDSHPTDLLFLGDSNTAWMPRNGPATWARLAAWRPMDFAVAGDRTEHLLWRVQHGELDGLHPKVTVLMIGTNNVAASVDEQPAWTAAGVRAVLDEVLQRLPDTTVLLLGVFPRVDHPAYQPRIDALNATIAGFADGRRVHWLYVGDAFREPDGSIAATTMFDGLHLTAPAYERWHAAMWPTLSALLGPPSAPTAATR